MLGNIVQFHVVKDRNSALIHMDNLKGQAK